MVLATVAEETGWYRWVNVLIGSDYIAHQFLVPSVVTALFALLSASIKVYEYRRHYDLSVVVSILSRVALGLLYLSDVTVINDRVIAIRFALTMLFAAEVMRQGLKHVGKRYGQA